MTVLSAAIPAFADIIPGPVNVGSLPDGYIMMTSFDNIFRMKDDPSKTFVMLDGNPDGDNSSYYVMTYDGYGYHEFDKNGSKRFNPNNPNNMAYWLNNDFKLNGNDKGPQDNTVYKLPESIINGIDYEHKWITESGNPGSDCADVDGTGYYVEKAGIGLLSYSEAIDYNGIYGCIDNFRNGSTYLVGPNDGWFLRTCMPDSAMLAIRPNFEPGKILAWDTKVPLSIRPTFYLTSDFLTKNGALLDMKYIGKNVKQAITQNCTREDLEKAGYSDSEIQSLFNTSQNSQESISVNVNMGIDENPYAEIQLTGIQNVSYKAIYGTEGGATSSVTLKNNAENRIEFDMDFDEIKNVFVEVYSDDQMAKRVDKRVSKIKSYKSQPLESLRQRGFATHFGQGTNSEKDIKLLKTAGVKLVRDEVYWNVVEQEKGVYRFDMGMTNWVDTLYANGIESIVVLSYGNPLYFDKRAPVTPDEIKAYANYCKAVAEHFTNVKTFEVWNEPNVGGFWNGKPNADEYSNMLKAASNAIKEVRPDAKVVGGVVSDYRTAESFLKKMLENDTYSYIDAVSIHPYYFYKDQDRSFFETRINVNKGLVDNLGGFKDLLITEVGWSTRTSDNIWNSDKYYTNMNGKPYFEKDGNVCFTVTDEQQAKKLVTAQVIADCYGISDYASYDFRDDGTNPYEFEENLGVVEHDGTVKPAYTAIKVLNQFVNGAVYCGRVKLDELDSQIHIYNQNGTAVAVAWNDKTSATVSLGNASVKDMYGRDLGQKSEVTLSESPIYLTDISNDWLFKSSAAQTSVYLNKALSCCKDDKNLSDFVYDVNSVIGLMDDVKAGNMPSETSCKQYTEQIFDAGDELIKAYNDGKTILPEEKISQILSHLFDAAENASNMYVSAAKEMPIVTNQLKSMQEIEKTKDLFNNTDDVSVYAKAIFKRANDVYGDLEIIKAEKDLKNKNGFATAKDILCSRTAMWARMLNYHEAAGDTVYVEASIDNSGNVHIRGAVNSDHDVVTLIVLPPDVEYKPGTLTNMSSIDYITEINVDKQPTFDIKYKTEGKFGKYTFVALAESWNGIKTCEAMYIGDSVISDIVKALQNAASYTEAEDVLRENKSVLESLSPLFKKTSGDNIALGEVAKVVYGYKSEITNSNTLTDSMEKASGIAALNTAKNADEFKRALTDYKKAIGFEKLKSYSTYNSSVFSSGDRVNILSSFAEKEYMTLPEWHNTMEEIIILTAIEKSTYTNVMDIINTNLDKLKINMGEYDKLSLNQKIASQKQFAGRRYGDYQAAADAFDKAVRDAAKTTGGSSGGSSGGGSGSSGGGGGGGASANYVPDTTQKVNTFGDLGSVPWAKNSILELHKLGIVNGKSETEFVPEDDVTREEFLKMLMCAFNLSGDGENVFEDVDPNAWYYKYVISGYNLDIISGESETVFGIGKNITREQMATMSYRLLKSMKYELPTDALSTFDDSSDISSYAVKPVCVLSQLNIINGMGDNNFAPAKFASRAEAAVIIHRLYNQFKK